MFSPDLCDTCFRRDATLDERVLCGPADVGVHQGPHPLRIPLPFAGATLWGYDAIRLSVENASQTTLHAGLELLHGTGARAVTGNREVLPPGLVTDVWFPRECFGVIGSSTGWSDVRQAELVACRPKGAHVPETLVVRVWRAVGLRRCCPEGPRLTESGLREVLGGRAAPSLTRRPWGAFASSGRSARIAPPHTHFYERDPLSRLVRGWCMGQRMDWPPDWSAEPPDDLHRAHFLHRHHALRPLAASGARRDGRAAMATAADIIARWIRACPVPVDSDGGASPAWETLSAAFRLREWFFVAGSASPLPIGSDAVERLVLRSVWEHARHLRDHRGHPGNWRMIEAASLTLAGLLFPEFTEARSWAACGFARLEDEVRIQFAQDGLHVEGSPLYHALCVQACLDVRETARVLGSSVPATVERGLAQACDALAGLARPDFTWPSINDSGGIDGDYRALMRYAGAAFGRSDYRWLGSRGRDGAPRVSLAHRFADAGLVVMRTSRAPDAHGLLFRAGTPDGSHTHGDCLSLEYWAHGHAVIVDPGIAGYGDDDAPARFRSAQAHSMPLVGVRGSEPDPSRVDTACADGGGAQLIGQDASPWQATGTCVLGGVRVERSVRLFESGRVQVRDLFDGIGPRDVGVRWQFAPGTLVVDPAGQAAVFTGTGGVGCSLRFDTPVGGLVLQRHTGVVARSGRVSPAPALTVTLHATLPAVITTVIEPLFPPDP